MEPPSSKAGELVQTIFLKDITPTMKQTLMVRLKTTKEQFGVLRDTMHRFNQACSFAPLPSNSARLTRRDSNPLSTESSERSLVSPPRW